MEGVVAVVRLAEAVEAVVPRVVVVKAVD